MSRGRRTHSPSQGITLIELLVSLAIIGMMLAIVYPNVTTGLDGIRLRTARDNISSLIYESKLRADRYNRPVVVWFEPEESLVKARAFASEWSRDVELPSAIALKRPAASNGFVLIPGVPPPAFRVLLETTTGDRAGLEISPFLGVAKDWLPDEGGQ